MGLVVEPKTRLLTAAEFQSLAKLPPEVEWFAKIENENSRRAYKTDVHDFMAFADIRQAEEFRLEERSHLITWRKQVEVRSLDAGTDRRKLSAAATDALDHEADIAKIKGWLEHTSISTTKLYDRRKTKPRGFPRDRERL